MGYPAYVRRQVQEVEEERDAQLRKWGHQHWPDGTGASGSQQDADVARDRCDLAGMQGCVTWRHILEEEFFEALAESDAARLPIDTKDN
jgi:hypothetical protein